MGNKKNYLCSKCLLKVIFARSSKQETVIKFCDICSKKIKEKMANGGIDIPYVDNNDPMDAVL